MNTILVDDELWAMKQFETECAAIPDIHIIGQFSDSIDALEFAKTTAVDFALIDIEMPEMNGIELAKRLKELYPEIIIVFVTAYEKYLTEFLKIKADYYVIKPYTKDDVLDVLSRAELLSKRQQKRIFIKTFGNFDLFIEGRLLYFSSAKAKELLALLVDRRGGIITSKEALGLLWENRVYDPTAANTYRKTLSRLTDILKKAGIENILITKPNGRALNTEMVECDLYSFLDGDEAAKRSFTGEYMHNYSWGEEKIPFLLSKI